MADGMDGIDADKYFDRMQRTLSENIERWTERVNSKQQPI
jgi:hypothetical protein